MPALSNFLVTAFLVTAFSGSALASARCDLLTSSIDSGGCLDLSTMSGKTIQVPANTTRIGQNGLAFCSPPTRVQVVSSDIAYLIDKSGSMSTNDPYNARVNVVRQALKYQSSIDSHSLAGVIQFSGSIDQSLSMRELNAAGLRDLLNNTNLIAASGGTDWQPPLNQAIVWLKSSASIRQKAIILVSDGEPSNISGYRALVSTAGTPPVYAIFLGSATASTPELDYITTVTGGAKYVVPPTRPDSMQGVINAIVKRVTGSMMSSATVANLSNGQISRPAYIATDSLRYRLTLDSVVGLVAGLNNIRIVKTSIDSGRASLDTIRFSLDVSGPTLSLGDSAVPNSPFNARCAESSVLKILDSSWSPVQYLTESSGRAGILLTPSGTAPFPMRVSLNTGAKDVETAALNASDSLSAGSWGRRMKLSVARTTAPVSGNQAIEVRPGLDTLRASWCQPRDLRDCASGSIEVRSMTAKLRWIPHALPGASGKFILEAVLPGQLANTIQAAISRHGVKVGNATLLRVNDTLFRDTIPFLQGGTRQPLGDTLWLKSPSPKLLDSLVANLTWGYAKTVLSDTATIRRPPLSLKLDWTGVGDSVLVSLSGGRPDAKGARPVRLSAGSLSQSVSLDSTLRLQTSVTALAATGKDSSIWIKGVFIDPVYGDTAIDSVVVPVPRKNLRFSPRAQIGPVGKFILEAVLPDQLANAIQATIERHGVKVGNATLLRVNDTLFRDTIPFLQGGTRQPLGDTLWLKSPSPKFLDSLVANLTWGYAKTVLSDTATIRRPPLSLKLDWTGVGDSVLVSLNGGQPDAKGARPVRLSAGSLGQSVSLDSTLRLQTNVTALAATGKDSSIWIEGVFIDPVYGDTAIDSVVVPVPRKSLRFSPRAQDGPAGRFVLNAILPGVADSSVTIVIWRRGVVVGTATMRCQVDSSFVGELRYSQRPTRPGGDSIWMGQPPHGKPDSLVAIYTSPIGYTLSDTALVTRPSFRLSMGVVGRTSIEMTIVGGMPDLKGTRIGDLTASSVQRVTFDTLGKATVDILSQLSKLSGVRAMVHGRFVDPVYGDTAVDSTMVTIPVRTLRFATNRLVAQRGAVRIELSDPWTIGTERTVVIAHGGDSTSVKLTRDSTGLFVSDVPFAHAWKAGGDTLALARNSKGLDSVFVVLAPQDSLPRLVDWASFQCPALSLTLTTSPGHPQLVRMALSGGFPDVHGEARVSLISTAMIPRTVLGPAGDFIWNGERDLAQLLPESRDSVRINAFFVDPTYGDTAHASLVLASPWFPASISALPELVDPRKGATVEIRVHDKDLNTLDAGQIGVTAGPRKFILTETGANTGEYVARLPASLLDPDWMHHPPREEWTVGITYADPNHPGDTARAGLRMMFNVPPPSMEVREPLLSIPTNATPGRPVLAIERPDPTGHYMPGAQGVELRIWEKTNASVFLYDNIGVSVGSWEGILAPEDIENGSKYLLRWDGRDHTGNPTAPGVYLMRVLLVDEDGRMLNNSVHKIGRK